MSKCSYTTFFVWCWRDCAQLPVTGTEGLKCKNGGCRGVSVTDTIFGWWELAVTDDVYIRNGSGTNIGSQTLKLRRLTIQIHIHFCKSEPVFDGNKYETVRKPQWFFKACVLTPVQEMILDISVAHNEFYAKQKNSNVKCKVL